MRTRTRWTTTSFNVAVTVFAAVACSDSTGPTGRARENPQQARLLRGLDREFAEIARQVPGFGGLSRSADGSIVLYLTDPSQLAAAKQAVAARSGVLRGIDLTRVQVRAAKFDYVQLTDWRARLRELDVPGLVFLDIDESNNRLHVGVQPGISHQVVTSAVTNLDVPADAVTIDDAEPVNFSTTLLDQVRPTVGGLQIAFTGADIPPGFFGVCTLAFNARQAGSSDTYLVTASHCSGSQGGVQHTEMFQPTPSPANLVALEHLDPDYFSDGCYPHRRCRFSDASLSRYLPGNAAAVGFIARTTLRGLTAGSGVIDAAQPSFTITDRQPLSLVGQTLDKIGRTTGWTVGTVWLTGVDVMVNGTDITLLDQDAMFSGVGGGDSGSPIFESQAAFTGDVTLHGILWGSTNTSFGPVVFFSNLENIESELGPLIVTAP